MADDPAASAHALARYRRIATIVLVIAAVGAVVTAVRGQWVSLAAFVLLAASQAVVLRSVH